MCVISYVRQNLCLPGGMLPGELRWLMKEQGPVTRAELPEGNYVKSGEQRLRWIPGYKPPPLSLPLNLYVCLAASHEVVYFAECSPSQLHRDGLAHIVL